MQQIKPLLKWTGGKYKEFNIFKDVIPAFTRYFEPFVGGGGVYFALQPEIAFLNDKSYDLIRFYSLIGNDDFKQELDKYIDNWENLDLLYQHLKDRILVLYTQYRENGINSMSLKKLIQNLINEEVIETNFSKLLNTSFIVESKGFKMELIRNIYSKISRIRSIEIKEATLFEPTEMYEHIETAIRGSFYMHLRNVLNTNKTPLSNGMSEVKRISNWFMVRELCYASMFRFNAKGDFNIPYGGIAYNRKNMRTKADCIFDNSVLQLMSRTKLYNLDFADFLGQFKFDDSDFIFLDPPYDSEFSEYDQNAFTKNDQIRLAECLYNCRAKWMLVIKNTEFIFNLYDKPAINISSFDKKYLYNVRGRNNRDTEHLIITNY